MSSNVVSSKRKFVAYINPSTFNNKVAESGVKVDFVTRYIMTNTIFWVSEKHSRKLRSFHFNSVMYINENILHLMTISLYRKNRDFYGFVYTH